MGRSPCCDEAGVKKGPWTPEEDKKLLEHVENHGHGNWRTLPRRAGLNRCGKSCRLRWTNYLRPDIKRGKFSDDEERLIIHLHSLLGNKWSTIATRLPGRTDNEIKNYWNTHIRKKLLLMGIDPVTHRRRADLCTISNFQNLLSSNIRNLNTTSLENCLKLQSDASQVASLQILRELVQMIAVSMPMTHLDDTMKTMSGPSYLPNYKSNCLPLAPQSIQYGPTNGSNPSQQLSLISYSSISEFNTQLDSNPSQMLCSHASASSHPSPSVLSESSLEKEEAKNILWPESVRPTSLNLFEMWEMPNLSDDGTDLGWSDILEGISSSW